MHGHSSTMTQSQAIASGRHPARNLERRGRRIMDNLDGTIAQTWRKMLFGAILLAVFPLGGCGSRCCETDSIQTDVGIAHVSTQFPRRCAGGEYKSCYIVAKEADREVGPSRYSLEIYKRGCLAPGNPESISPDDPESADNFRACTTYLRQMVAYFKRAGVQTDLLEAGQQAALRCNYPIADSRGSNATERKDHCDAAMLAFGAGVDHRGRPAEDLRIYQQIASPAVAAHLMQDRQAVSALAKEIREERDKGAPSGACQSMRSCADRCDAVYNLCPSEIGDRDNEPRCYRRLQQCYTACSNSHGVDENWLDSSGRSIC